ncbi:hypothetical protein [Mycobacterium bourgelatii]|nr:hypothetical protein [Mycobacterium bourgelatii]MCV6974100.1 hypothetical protein [Mycobacterium bourgelatii]
MWCPSVSLSMWANAWLAGKAAPDDVLDSLSLWAPKQSVAAYDAVAAGHTGLPWPDVDDAGTVSLLQTLRAAVGRPPSSAVGAINVVLPVPGDVRGLCAGTQFEQDAIAAGEAVIVANQADPGTAIGLVPEFSYSDVDTDETVDGDDAAPPELCALTWMVYSLPGVPVLAHHELGDAEYTLRSAVRSAADALSALGLESAGSGIENPRGLVEQMLETLRQHRIPDHAPSRALRVLENAAHVDAIMAVSAGMSQLPVGTRSLSEAELATDALRPLAGVVRSARMAAVSAILYSAWSD